MIFFVYCPEYYSGNCPLLSVSCQLSIVNCQLSTASLSSALVVLCERTCCWIKLLSLLRNLPNGFAVPSTASIPSATTPPLRLRCYSPLSTVLCPTFNCQLSIVNYQLSIINCPLSTINCQLSTVNCQLSIVNCQLSTVNCPLSLCYWPLISLRERPSTLQNCTILTISAIFLAHVKKMLYICSAIPRRGMSALEL